MKTKIYLLPGTMCNETLWSKLNLFFDESYELIHVPIPSKNSMDDIVDRLNEYFLEEKILLLGFSLGGYIASYFTCKYPNRVKKLFIVSSSLNTLSVEEIQKRQKAILFVDTHGFKGLSQKKVKTLLEEVNQKDEALINLIQQMYVGLGKEVFKTQMQTTLHRKDLLEKFLRLNTPSTFLYCDKDRLVNHKWLERLKKESLLITIIKRQGASHMVPLERPLELSLAIKEWIKEIPY